MAEKRMRAASRGKKVSGSKSVYRVEKGGCDKAASFVRGAWGLAADLVFPRRCPVCDRPVRPFGALICPECLPMLVKIREPVCRRCGKPLRNSGAEREFSQVAAAYGGMLTDGAAGYEAMLPDGAVGFDQRLGRPLRSRWMDREESDGLCRGCRTNAHLFERGCAVFSYHSAAGGIFRFKYGGRREYGAFYGKCMAEKMKEISAGGWKGVGAAARGKAFGSPQAPGPAGERGISACRPGLFPLPDMLVPVPLSGKRLEKRGYNQALVLAEEISTYTGLPVQKDVLRRVAETPPLKKMSFPERQNNLKKAFQAFGNDVKLKTIMLIDDIYTTGATMDACADALYRQGARSVCFMALAAGEDLL